MHSDRHKGWRMDAPEPPVTSPAREVEGLEVEHQLAAESAVHDFAAVAAAAADAGQIGRSLEAAARWAAVHESFALQLDATATANVVADASPAETGATAAVVPIRVAEGERVWGRFLLEKRGGGDPVRRPEIARRRLETLARLAAFAFERLEAGPRTVAAAEAAQEPSGPSTLHDATLISAVLPFAMAQARRHEEPLSILCVGIDQIRGVRELLGPAAAAEVVERVGARVASLVRSSDLVGRLDDDRLMVILPRSGLQDAVRVGDKLRRRIAAADLLSFPLALSVSVGAASAPESAESLGGLLDAADAALSDARRIRCGAVAAARLDDAGRGDAAWISPGPDAPIIC